MQRRRWAPRFKNEGSAVLLRFQNNTQGTRWANSALESEGIPMVNSLLLTLLILIPHPPPPHFSLGSEAATDGPADATGQQDEDQYNPHAGSEGYAGWWGAAEYGGWARWGGELRRRQSLCPASFLGAKRQCSNDSTWTFKLLLGRWGIKTLCPFAMCRCEASISLSLGCGRSGFPVQLSSLYHEEAVAFFWAQKREAWVFHVTRRKHWSECHRVEDWGAATSLPGGTCCIRGGQECIAPSGFQQSSGPPCHLRGNGYFCGITQGK